MKMKVMTYNIQSCLDYDTRKRDTQARLAAFIKEQNPDVVVLNEVHDIGASKEFTAQAKDIADLLGWNHRFAQAIDIPNVGPYGNAILSPYPIENFTVTPVPLQPLKEGDNPGWREARCILRAEITKDGKTLAVYGSHFGLTPGEQEFVVSLAAGLLDNETLPHVFMGDFNMQPDNPTLVPLFERMQDTAAVFDAPKLSYVSDEPTDKIDYIFASRDVTVLNADIPAVVISDHRPYIAEIEF